MASESEWLESGEQWVLQAAGGVTGRVIQLSEGRWGGGIVIEPPGTHETPEDARKAVEGLLRQVFSRQGETLAAEF